MKTILHLFTLFIIFVVSAKAQSTKDLPLPAANLITLTTGSYVIPMDNTLQANDSGYFNLKTYGLIVYLLNNNVKLKWVIKTGKVKNGIDFTVDAERILPTPIAVAPKSFIAGPFVIQAADTTGVAALVTSYYALNSLTNNSRPSIYKTSIPVTVDMRYDLTGFKPKAAILNDGGNANIHIKYMQAAGVPTSNYQNAVGVDLITKCYTFASEPHATSITNQTASAVRSFVTYGGNFLAQCEAVTTYENHLTYGHFHTTNGITKVNLNVADTSTVYPNPDLSFSQYQGKYNISAGGSVRNWVLSNFSSYINNAHHHATGTVISQTAQGASVAKMNASNKAGGLVFYIGNHEFSSYNDVNSVNGIRMYMNAFLTPASLNMNCTIGTTNNYVLSVNTEYFTAVVANNNAVLEWNASPSSTPESFVIEKSIDGKIFYSIGKIEAVNGRSNYKYNDPLYMAPSILYYRVKATDAVGHFTYSAVRALRISTAASSIQIFPNPVSNEIMVQLPASWISRNINYEIIDQSGRMIWRESGKVYSNLHRIKFNTNVSGTYFIKTECDGQTLMQKFLKQ
jgi:hypothetical protein